MMIQHLGKEFYIDNKLAKNIQIYVKNTVKANEDCLLLIDGPEGSGKSVLSRQIAWTISYFLKNDHNIDYTPSIDDLHYTLPNYIQKARSRTKFQTNILDESRSVLNRKRSMAKEPVMFTNYLSECRKENQFHILNVPAFHDLEKYVVHWRCKLLIHVQKKYTDEGDIVRGNFVVYPITNSLLYYWEEGKYRYPRANYKEGAFQGRFNNVEPFEDMDKFYKKQADAMDEKYDLTKEKTSSLDKRDEMLMKLTSKYGYSEISRIVGMTPTGVRDAVKRFENKSLPLINIH